jgi:putative ABC transport system permease protein
VAREIQRAVFAQGAEALTISDLAAAEITVGKVLLDTVRFMLGIGLLIGVLSLGILTLRAVVERRRSIGVLRALGYRPGNVLAGMLVEVLLTATIGSVVGIGVGLLIGILLAAPTFGAANFRVEGSFVALTLASMYATALAVTFVPALRAARLPAAEALRVED